jgi:hypothetical protein
MSPELQQWAYSQHIDQLREIWWGELTETERQARLRRKRDELSVGDGRDFWARNPRALEAAALEGAQRAYAEERCPFEQFVAGEMVF